MHCSGKYTVDANGNVTCTESYVGPTTGKNRQNAQPHFSFSFIMYGIHKCSGTCYYCSAAKSMSYRDQANKSTFKYDWDKAEAKIFEYFKKMGWEDETCEGKAACAVDVWGGNPVENREPFKKTIEFLETRIKPHFKDFVIHTSGNGLEMQHKGLVKYLKDHNIKYQLSHDGLGQWQRTPGIDPLYWDKTKDNLLDLVKNGNLDWINCTLSYRNYSFFANIEYWNKWRKENGIWDKPITIKLNHIYPGTLPVNKVYDGPDDLELTHGQICKGEIIGDLNFRGEQMNEYLHEFRKLALICLLPDIRNNKYFAPYINYTTGQMWRYKELKKGMSPGMCRDFQAGLIDYNFAIDTIGEYSQCNLIDSSSKVLNSTASQASYCKGCKYEHQSECNSCGSENPEPFDPKTGRCTYKYQWLNTLEEFAQLRVLLDALKKKSCDCKK